ncbi:MAG TPA: hypothetical protein VF717_09005 [Pyrinomonadaceae bacterium]
MKGSFLFISLALVLAFAPASAQAQQRGRTGRGGAAPGTRRTDEKAEARRAQAVTLLVETADSARAFRDLQYRARIQLLAADALWPFDEARARQIFRRAWEAASAADRAEQRAAGEEAGVFPGSEEMLETAARDEVLSKAAARDAKMAEAFMREMLQERDKAQEAANQPTRRTPWREPSTLGARRLALAYELMGKRDYARAAQIAEPAIAEGVSGDAMEFILRLRAFMGEASDPYGLYRRMVQRTAANPDTDANDLLRLSSFVVSPQLLMAVDEKGGLQFRPVAYASPLKNLNQADPISSKYFYDLAVAFLLRPQPPSRARTINPAQERIARYVITGRLIPFFERAAAEYAQYVPVMRSQLNQLSGEIEAGRREALSAQFELTSLAGKNARDPLAPQLEQLARANGGYERDRISLGLARRAARERLWDRAQRAAYGIEDGDLRRAALAYIAVNQIADISRAYRDDKEDDSESVARFVRRAEAPPFASAWGLSQAAVIAARKKESSDEVNALLTEAQSYAERADKDSRQRVAAYAVITDAAARVSKERAWDFFSELVRAANSTPDYMGDETALATSAGLSEGSDLSEELSIESDSFRLDNIFATMARIDFDKAAAQAQALTGEIPRAYARIATARAALGK